MECKICKYDTHVDVCHIKAIGSFSGHTTIAKINSMDNLVTLCKNHHWEFDKGLVTL